MSTDGTVWSMIIKHNEYMYTVIWRYMSPTGKGNGPIAFTMYGLFPGGKGVHCVEKTPLGEFVEHDASPTEGYRWLRERIDSWMSSSPKCSEPGPHEGPVTWGPNPLEEEVWGDERPHWICKYHRDALTDAI